MSVTREEVLWAFRCILGREPESESIVALHMKCMDFPALREGLLLSKEFQTLFQSMGGDASISKKPQAPGP
jgi:hypothetical protein